MLYDISKYSRVRYKIIIISGPLKHVSLVLGSSIVVVVIIYYKLYCFPKLYVHRSIHLLESTVWFNVHKIISSNLFLLLWHTWSLPSPSNLIIWTSNSFFETFKFEIFMEIYVYLWKYSKLIELQFILIKIQNH